MLTPFDDSQSLAPGGGGGGGGGDGGGVRNYDGLVLDAHGGVPSSGSALDDARRSGSAAKGLLLSLGWLDRLLTPLIILSMILGVVIGRFAPHAKERLHAGDFEGVATPLVVGLIVMMWPILTKVQYERLPDLFKTPRIWWQVTLSLVLNWVLGPLLMLALAWATLPDLEGYRIGIILVGLARCIAMVMIWNQMARGDSTTCAILVILNSLLQILLYAPLALLFINVISSEQTFELGYANVATSVAIYLGIPLGAGVVTRFLVIVTAGRHFFQHIFLPLFSPLSLLALLYTIIIIFASQARQILDHLGPVFRTMVPLVVYFALMWGFTFFLVWSLSIRCGHRNWGYQMAVVQSFTAGSNNFELAIAVAVAVYGADSQQALAATIGPLVEVPVLLLLTWIALFVGRRMRWDVQPSRDDSVDPDTLEKASVPDDETR